MNTAIPRNRASGDLIGSIDSKPTGPRLHIATGDVRPLQHDAKRAVGNSPVGGGEERSGLGVAAAQRRSSPLV